MPTTHCECNALIAPGAFRQKHMRVLHMLSSGTRAMGRFLDVLWCDLSVIFTMDQLRS